MTNLETLYRNNGDSQVQTSKQKTPKQQHQETKQSKKIENQNHIGISYFLYLSFPKAK